MSANERRPKRANGEGGGRQRSNGTWEWRHTTANGRRFSAYGKTQAAAKAACMAKVRQAEKGIDPNAAKQKLADYLAWWLQDVVTPKVQPKTIDTYRKTIDRYVVPDLGRLELGKLTAQDVTTLLRRHERQGLSPRTVAMIREVLRNALNVAVRLQMVERNAAALATPPRQVKVEPRTFSLEEARRLLDVTERDRLAALYQMALALGVRQGELIGLRWQDVDLAAGTLRVNQTVQRIGTEVFVQEPKTPRSRRTVTLPRFLVTALVAHRDRQDLERLQSGTRWRETGLVFTSSTGTALDGRNLSREFKRHLVAANLPPTLRFYDMRHAAASILLAEGVPITSVSALLGHALTSTTFNNYAHVLPGADRVPAEAMERLLG